MNSQQSKAIIKDLCRKLNITNEQALEIIKSEFYLVREAMNTYDYGQHIYPVIRLPKFGVFFVKPSKKVNYGKKEEEVKNSR